ncbi:MAG: hypothetical protein NVS1B4_13380 [Gemmatimonadaceae bacterium]
MNRPANEPAALPRELAEFLVELSIALHKHAIYPPTHPLLAGAAAGVSRTLGLLLANRASLSLGVARQQLVIDGMATDPHNSLLRELAERLHRHHLGAVTFDTGAVAAEVAALLHAVAGDAERHGALGLMGDDARPTWPHIRLHPLSYGQLELVTGGGSDLGAPAGSHSAHLWVGLASAALAGGGGTGGERSSSAVGRQLSAGENAAGGTAELAAGGGSPSRSTTGDAGSADRESEAEHTVISEPADVARAIDEHGREVAYDQVIVGYLLQIADELKREGGADTAVLRTRVSKMVGSLDPATLRQLLGMGGDALQRRRFLLDASQTLTVDAVVELVQAAAQPGYNVSHSLMRVMRKLAAHATTAGDAGGEADVAVRESVRGLLDRWSLVDPNPGGYGKVLEAMSHTAPTIEVAEGAVACEPERIIEMAIEVGTTGESVWRAVDTMANSRRLSAVLDLADRAPSSSPVAALVAERAASPARLRELLMNEQDDGALIARVTRKLGLAACEPLLDALETHMSGRSRVRVVELLAALGPEAGSVVAKRLAGAHPATQRDLIGVIGKMASLPPGFSAESFANHPDPAVRREALKLMMRDPGARDRALVLAVSDADERTVLIALGEALERCPPIVVAAARGRVDRGELEPPVRALAVRVVAAHGSGDTPAWLAGVATKTKRWLLRTRLAPSSPEVLAAITGLAHHWGEDPRAATVLALALRSPDPDIMACVTRSGTSRAIPSHTRAKEMPR